ncbi:MAG: hypothetical protein RIQ89_2177 [Bacteroidota bacterium]|jgi:ABC-2 type transport system ATP-binding protein
MNDVVLEINALTKKYQSTVAVNGLSFKVQKGSIFGMLGPNGSGKTTTLGMILGVTLPTTGNFKWFGKPFEASLLRRVGAILETPNFYPYLSAQQNMEVVAKIKNVDHSAIQQVLELVGLATRKHDPFRAYSLGMKQRLAIAAAYVNRPEVLLLDEPTNGLDPQGIADVRTLIKDIASHGTTIILASHLLDEVEKVCTDAVVLKQGTALFAGPVKNLMTQEMSYEIAALDMALLKKVILTLEGITLVNDFNKKLLVKLSDGLNGAWLNDALHKHQVVLTHLSEYHKSLEKHFLDLIK